MAPGDMGRSGFEFMLGPKIRATVFKKEHPTRLFLAWLRARPPTKLIDPGVAPASTCRSRRTGRWSTVKDMCSIWRMNDQLSYMLRRGPALSGYPVTFVFDASHP